MLTKFKQVKTSIFNRRSNNTTALNPYFDIQERQNGSLAKQTLPGLRGKGPFCLSVCIQI